MNRPLMVLALALVFTACSKAEEEAAPVDTTPAADVHLALTVSAAIEMHPGAIDSVLSAHALTRVSFDSLLFRIAADSAMAAQYAAGRQP